MRVIAGQFKGRRLKAPRFEGLRPTSDQLRETLFNILAPHVAGSTVLDGFAGTGAVGIEALSRGARHVTFVERDPRALKLIARNLDACGIVGGYSIIRGSVMRASSLLIGESFDIVVLDPPYDIEDLSAVVSAVAPLVAEAGTVVLEHARRRHAPTDAGPLVRRRDVRSGDSALTFYAAAA
ncbi:MAG: 16S rRNA (guanine(966)-N(2))-methyltransferase RsmD [Acidobacteria bacterium]|nr:16S rRNA (guanine(966)-N(2))-methyltransferase RsmD [Acidobacteriota bacterium]